MGQTNTDYYNHPVFEPERLHIQTPAMKRLSEELHRWLWTGTTGGVILGMSRTGKTRAVRSLQSSLYTRGKIRVPVYYLSISDRDVQTILSVFRRLCWSVNLRNNARDKADHLSERFVHYIADNATEKNCRHAVLIVDEMQRLCPKQFNAFAEVYDQLLLLGINLMVVFVGNEQECWKLKEAIGKDRYAHIRGRFFTQGLSYKGLVSKAEVNYCLSQYDNLRYPNKGPTYTEYFLPEAVKNGWRLSALSGDVWRIYREYQKNDEIESWGMQFFLAAINTLLTDFLPTYGVDHFNDDMIHESIRISGLLPSLVWQLK
ncbi:MAG: ATP-binding protein [Gammaproteobacteria bacterium]|nr:ATP-binding protein [Gammaproteobacteria bacterium]